jgi:quinol monooxygenase YgiN
MIYVIATVEIIEGKRGEYLRELKKVIPDVRAETGCLEYGPAGDIATDIPVQAPVNEHVVTIIERWTDILYVLSRLMNILIARLNEFHGPEFIFILLQVCRQGFDRSLYVART